MVVDSYRRRLPTNLRSSVRQDVDLHEKYRGSGEVWPIWCSRFSPKAFLGVVAALSSRESTGARKSVYIWKLSLAVKSPSGAICQGNCKGGILCAQSASGSVADADVFTCGLIVTESRDWADAHAGSEDEEDISRSS